ncbi:undecaprenyl phosphate translocase family protein [Paraclostridium sp. AKS73]|uniref:undecaprenyl phosphate translocase family protein n=1 Tax=Paraclostridium sp. AKS73 TaxID=2876116 RepID=UPI002FCCD1E8
MYTLNFIRGFCMALADSVPGVSGGTVAFILGFYDQFVNSLNHLISGNKEYRIKGLKFLSKIGIGWVVGFILSVLFITSIFEKIYTK